MAAIVAFLTSTLLTTLVQDRWERRFVRAHPALTPALTPLKLRLLPLAVVGALLGGVALSLIDDGDRSPLYVLGGLVLEIAALRALGVARKRVGRLVSPDSPHGRRIVEVAARFGHSPREIVVSPSLLPNAFALPNGNVAITASLWHTASADEIAALLVHELSHLRDGDSRWIQAVFVATLILTMALAVGVAFGIDSLPAGGPYAIPAGLLTVPIALQAASLATNRWRIRMEFKCDADAARLELGENLARLLIRIHAFRGVPRRWEGLDRVMLSHPSLDERLSRLNGGPDALRIIGGHL